MKVCPDCKHPIEECECDEDIEYEYDDWWYWEEDFDMDDLFNCMIEKRKEKDDRE